MSKQPKSQPQSPRARVSPLELSSESARHTRALGARLGEVLTPGDVVLLSGELGAGKTVFTQGIGEGLGVTSPINSPTFTLLKEYDGRVPLYHFDLYRIEDPEELFDLGFDQYFGGEGVCVVEWAERAEAKDPGMVPWPENWLRVTLHARGPHMRTLHCEAAGPRGEVLLGDFARASGEGSAR
jgi:tRNA threonylcarbamoyladenosine biosynthesis protein TsaE